MQNELDLAYSLIKFWRRYVDDILLIWSGTEEEWECFKNEVSNIFIDGINAIKLTHDAGDELGLPCLRPRSGRYTLSSESLLVMMMLRS